MLLVILYFASIVFVSLTINRKFTKNITTRTGWGKPILKMLSVSWLVALLLTASFFLGRHLITNTSEPYNIYQSFYHAISSVLHGDNIWFYMFIHGGAIGILMGFVIAYLAAVTFNPQKKLYRLFIPTIASICVLLGIFPLGYIFAVAVYPAKWEWVLLLLRSAI